MANKKPMSERPQQSMNRALGYMHRSTPSETEEAAERVYRYRMAIGSAVRQLREEAGMTQTKLGELLGMTDGGVSNIELSRGTLSPERCVELADIFDLDRAEWGKFILQYQNPWLYSLIYGARKADVKEAMKAFRRKPKGDAEANNSPPASAPTIKGVKGT